MFELMGKNIINNITLKVSLSVPMLSISHVMLFPKMISVNFPGGKFKDLSVSSSILPIKAPLIISDKRHFQVS